MSDQLPSDDPRHLLAENGAAGSFDRYQDRLRGLVSVRLDKLLQDVDQDTYVEVQQRSARCSNRSSCIAGTC